MAWCQCNYTTWMLEFGGGGVGQMVWTMNSLVLFGYVTWVRLSSALTILQLAGRSSSRNIKSVTFVSLCIQWFYLSSFFFKAHCNYISLCLIESGQTCNPKLQHVRALAKSCITVYWSLKSERRMRHEMLFRCTDKRPLKQQFIHGFKLHITSTYKPINQRSTKKTNEYRRCLQSIWILFFIGKMSTSKSFCIYFL